MPNPSLIINRHPKICGVYELFIPSDSEPIGCIWECPTSTSAIPRWICRIDFGTTSHTSTQSHGYGLTRESAATNALRNALYGATSMKERIEAICERCEIRRIL